MEDSRDFTFYELRRGLGGRMWFVNRIRLFPSLDGCFYFSQRAAEEGFESNSLSRIFLKFQIERPDEKLYVERPASWPKKIAFRSVEAALARYDEAACPAEAERLDAACRLPESAAAEKPACGKPDPRYNERRGFRFLNLFAWKKQ